MHLATFTVKLDGGHYIVTAHFRMEDRSNVVRVEAAMARNEVAALAAALPMIQDWYDRTMVMPA